MIEQALGKECIRVETDDIDVMEEVGFSPSSRLGCS